MSSKVKRLLRRKTERLALQFEKPRVLIGTPVIESCLATYVRSLVPCIGHCLAHQILVGYRAVEYSILALSRQKLADLALEEGWTHLLFIDSDMMFPYDLVTKLLSHHHPIVAANCMARRHPYSLTARDENQEEIQTLEHSTGIEKVARAGTGVMLVSVEVFKAIQAPWFDSVWLPEKRIFRGEDFSFCDKAREAGFEIYIDHDVSKQIEHWGIFGFHPLMRQGFKDAQAEQERLIESRNA